MKVRCGRNQFCCFMSQLDPWLTMGPYSINLFMQFYHIMELMVPGHNRVVCVCECFVTSRVQWTGWYRIDVSWYSC